MTGAAHSARLLKVAEVAQEPLGFHKEPGTVYFLRARRFYKIGWAKDLKKRRAQLQSGNPHRLELMASVAGTRSDESMLHHMMRKDRHRGEWFRHEPHIYYIIQMINEEGSVSAMVERIRKEAEALEDR